MKFEFDWLSGFREGYDVNDGNNNDYDGRRSMGIIKEGFKTLRGYSLHGHIF